MSAHPTDIDRSLSILDKLAAEQLNRANGATEFGALDHGGYSPESLPSDPPPDAPDTPLSAYADEISRVQAEPYIPPTWVQNEPVGGSGAFQGYSGEIPPADFWKESAVPEMRHEWMPPEFADLFCHESETWGTDPGIYGMFGRGICAGALSNAVRVQVRDGDPHALKAARLWIGVSGYSGSGKTPILIAMARPLEELQEKLMEECAWAIKKHKDDHEIYEKQRQAYISARAKGESATPPTEPEQPTRNRLIVKNMTLEALPPILTGQGPRGILGLYDELTAFPTSAGQYKKGGNDIEEMLKLRDGGRHTVDRQGTFIPIPEYAMSITGGTQPDRMRKVVKNMDLTSNGFLQRFNWYIARKAKFEQDRPAHADFARMAEIVERIYHLQADKPVTFDDGAKEVMREFRLWCFEQRQNAGMSESLQSHLSKFADMFAEFCLTDHAIQSADRRSMFILPQISEATALRVRDFMQQCLYPHAKAFYSDVIESDSEILKHVRYLAGKILAKKWATIDLTRCAQGWTKFRTFKPWEKKAIFTMLQEGGWIKSKDPRGYVEGMGYSATVNHAVHELFNEYAEIESARLEVLAESRAEKMGREPGEEG